MQDLGEKVYEDTKEAIQNQALPDNQQDQATEVSEPEPEPNSHGTQSHPAGSSGQTPPQLQQPSGETVETARYDKPWVSEIQSRLTSLGYNPGPVDGAFGSKTRMAIIDFERRQGLQPTGLPTPSVMQALRSDSRTPAHVETATPSIGSVDAVQQTQQQAGTQVQQGSADDSPRYDSAWISEIQTRLLQQGYTPGPASGTFGKATAAAIAAFQQNAGLAVTGLPTSLVMNHLRAGSTTPSPLPAPKAQQQVATSAPSQASAPSKGQRIRRVNSDALQLSAHLRASSIWAGEFGRFDAIILTCTGVREPIRDNYDTILTVAFQQEARKRENSLKAFDGSYQRSASQIEKQGCDQNLVESAYRGYAGYEQKFFPLPGVTDRDIETAAHNIHVACLKTSGHRSGTLDCDCSKERATRLLSDGALLADVQADPYDGCYRIEARLEQDHALCVSQAENIGYVRDSTAICSCYRHELQEIYAGGQKPRGNEAIMRDCIRMTNAKQD
jgi:peptidoglycan hydrolase-like protein with peptidoglycan-binding domain